MSRSTNSSVTVWPLTSLCQRPVTNLRSRRTVHREAAPRAPIGPPACASCAGSGRTRVCARPAHSAASCAAPWIDGSGTTPWRAEKQTNKTLTDDLPSVCTSIIDQMNFIDPFNIFSCVGNLPPPLNRKAFFFRKHVHMTQITTNQWKMLDYYYHSIDEYYK